MYCLILASELFLFFCSRLLANHLPQMYKERSDYRVTTLSLKKKERKKDEFSASAFILTNLFVVRIKCLQSHLNRDVCVLFMYSIEFSVGRNSTKYVYLYKRETVQKLMVLWD